jgi:hypothetical protein
MILRFLGIGLGALGGSALVLAVLAARAARRRSGVEEAGPADGGAFAGALIGAITFDVGLVLYLLG